MDQLDLVQTVAPAHPPDQIRDARCEMRDPPPTREQGARSKEQGAGGREQARPRAVIPSDESVGRGVEESPQGTSAWRVLETISGDPRGSLRRSLGMTTAGSFVAQPSRLQFLRWVISLQAGRLLHNGLPGGWDRVSSPFVLRSETGWTGDQVPFRQMIHNLLVLLKLQAVSAVVSVPYLRFRRRRWSRTVEGVIA